MRLIFFLVLFTISLAKLSAQDSLQISDKAIVKSFTCYQSLDSLWWRWTTHDGLKTFFGADNKVDLFPGGAYEIYFLNDKPYGQKGTEGCTLLSLLPKRMLSFSWIAPPSMPALRSHPHRTYVIVELQALAAEETLVTLTHRGWPSHERWQAAYDYFNGAWEYVVSNLKKFDAPTNTRSKTKIVEGIGGIFFKSKNPKELKQWYADHLGFSIDAYGANFQWRLADEPNKKGQTQWTVFKESTSYFLPSTKDFMLNYRVHNLDTLALQLKQQGVTLCDSVATYDYGKFLHILDIDGNKIELWEPVDSLNEVGEGEKKK